MVNSISGRFAVKRAFFFLNIKDTNPFDMSRCLRSVLVLRTGRGCVDVPSS